MNDCANGQVRDLLPDLLHDRLAPAERAMVEGHVATCAECREELALLRDLRASVPPGAALDVATIAAAIPSYAVPARSSRSSWRIAAAITLVAAGGASLAVATRDRGAPAHSAPVAVGAEMPRVRAIDTPGPTESPTSTAIEPARAATAAPSPVRQSPVGQQGELPMTAGVLTELSDSELASLLSEIGELDGVTSNDVDEDLLVMPVDVERSTR